MLRTPSLHRTFRLANHACWNKIPLSTSASTTVTPTMSFDDFVHWSRNQMRSTFDVPVNDAMSTNHMIDTFRMYRKETSPVESEQFVDCFLSFMVRIFVNMSVAKYKYMNDHDIVTLPICSQHYWEKHYYSYNGELKRDPFNGYKGWSKINDDKLNIQCDGQYAR
eukprot:419756_1